VPFAVVVRPCRGSRWDLRRERICKANFVWLSQLTEELYDNSQSLSTPIANRVLLYFLAVQFCIRPRRCKSRHVWMDLLLWKKTKGKTNKCIRIRCSLDPRRETVATAACSICESAAAAGWPPFDWATEPNYCVSWTSAFHTPVSGSKVEKAAAAKPAGDNCNATPAHRGCVLRARSHAPDFYSSRQGW